MTRPTVIVTGLIGSGKSAVCALLRERGIPVYDCDARTKSLYDRRPALVLRLEEALETPLRNASGKLDRARLAGVIFSDAAARETLEGIVYPELLKDFKRWRSRQKGAPYVVLESAVILSKPVFDGIARAVVLVEAPEELRLQRVLSRDKASEQAVRARMAAQDIPLEAVDVRIRNNGSPDELRKAAELVFFEKNSYICKLLNKHNTQ